MSARRASALGAKLKSYKLSSSSSSSAALVRTATGHAFGTDLPTAVGGRDSAPQPVELLLGALLGCKTATAHFVARHLWARPHNCILRLDFSDVVAQRDERGALAMPIRDEPPCTAALLRVEGVATVTAASSAITAADVEALGALVSKRCPVAATLHAAGCDVSFSWLLAPPAGRL